MMYHSVGPVKFFCALASCEAFMADERLHLFCDKHQHFMNASREPTLRFNMSIQEYWRFVWDVRLKESMKGHLFQTQVISTNTIGSVVDYCQQPRHQVTDGLGNTSYAGVRDSEDLDDGA